MPRLLITATLAVLLIISTPAAFCAALWEQPVAKVAASTAFLVDFQNGQVEGYCTAFSINDTKDYFLTAYHCGAEQMTIDGHPAFPIFWDLDADLLVLVVPDSGIYPSVTPAPMHECRGGGKETACVGEDIAGLGHGFGVSQLLLKTGIVSQSNLPDPELKTEVYLVMDSTFIPGMSGGPVFNSDGKIVSIVQMTNQYVGIGRVLNEILARTGKYWENYPAQ